MAEEFGKPDLKGMIVVLVMLVMGAGGIIKQLEEHLKAQAK